MQWYLKPFINYANFSGRARRKEYWTFVIFNAVIMGVISVISQSIKMFFIPGILGILILIPTFAVLVRRLHDTGKSGSFILIGLIPLIGQILFLIQLIKDSDKNVNKFGKNPKNPKGR